LKCNIVFCLVFIFIFNDDLFAFLLLLFLLGKSYDECQHDNRYRKSLRRIFWKPIIPLFIELIKTKNFSNYFRFYKNGLVLLNDNTYSDIVHGNKSQESLSRMNKTFRSFRSTNRLNLDANVLATIKPIPFLLSTFYDGIVLFKRNAQTVNLLLMSILNFPPSMRYKLGVGEYTIASHLKVPTVNGNDLVESFLFQQLLSDELNMLSDGIYVNINEKPYYILGEMVNIQADTIALNKISGCQAAHNSIWGCYLCGNCHGRQCTNLKKRLYNGLRVELNILNPLRYFGQTGSCCKKILSRQCSYY
jgi:hypothetical protein